MITTFHGHHTIQTTSASPHPAPIEIGPHHRLKSCRCFQTARLFGSTWAQSSYLHCFFLTDLKKGECYQFFQFQFGPVLAMSFMRTPYKFSICIEYVRDKLTKSSISRQPISMILFLFECWGFPCEFEVGFFVQVN